MEGSAAGATPLACAPLVLGGKIPPVKIFFVTDLHGSEICWKKFLNAGSFYGADVVILGRRRHRQGHGTHRPARQRHLGGLPPGPSRHPRV